MKSAKLCIAASSLLLLASASSCVVDDGDVGASDQALTGAPSFGITWNGITWNGITWNGLTTHPTGIQYLLDNSLSTSTYAVRTDSKALALRAVTADPDTRVFMKYLVSCALSDGAEVKWRNPYNSQSETYHGGLGFCPQWQSGGVAGDTDCQEKVSACLLSRLNAFGAHVMLSMRGMDAHEDPFIPADPMPANGKPIASQEPCSSASYGDENCGWDVGWVGTCSPRSSVTVNINCTGSDLVRVCDRPYGCDRGGAHYVTTQWPACSRPTITFTCPDRGSYALIGRPYDSTDTYRGFTATASSGLVPASEKKVFPYREGASYGNIFVGAELGVYTWISIDGQGVTTKWYYTPQSGWTQSLPSGPYVVHKGAYMCNSPEWDLQTAFKQMRICMGPSGNQCAANWAGNCSSAKQYPGQSFVTAPYGLCGYEDSPAYRGDGDYDKCKGGDQVWLHPVSIWLQDWCDATPDPQLAPKRCLTSAFQP